HHLYVLKHDEVRPRPSHGCAPVSLLNHNVTTGHAALAPSERATPAPKPLLAIEHLTKHFPLKGAFFGRTSALVQAVDDVSFVVERGETLGIVGESGCGKSTTARLILHLIKPDRGSIVFDGQRVGVPDGLSQRALHRQMQMVFQDSYASLNPRLPVAMSIAFGPFVHGLGKSEALFRAAELLEAVGLEPALFANRYPHELSGGQRQRINVA